MDTRKSVCVLCPLGCNIAFLAKGEAVVGPEFVSAGGDHDARVCARGIYGTELLNHPQRVAEPFVRREGRLRESSWPAAVEQLASALRGVIETHGPESVAIVTEPTRSTRELEAVGHLARTIGAGAVSCLFEPQDWPLVARETSAGVSAVVEANCVIAFGDVFQTHPVIAKEIIDAKYTARGNSLFVVDPRRTNTAWFASDHVQNRPGTEALVLACMLKSLKTSGKVAADCCAWLDSIDEKSLLDTAGVSRDAVARMARSFMDAGKAAIVVAPPVRGMYDVALVSRLARQLAAACGDQKECILLPSGGNVRGAQDVIAKGGWTPVSTLVAELETGKYRALVSLGADLVAEFPSTALAEAIGNLDLVASVSLFRGEFEKSASIVLGSASWLESDGSALLFDGSLVEWKAVGGPSWGTRTLVDIVSLIEAAMGQGASHSKSSDKKDTVAASADSDAVLAARIKSVLVAAQPRLGYELLLVTLPSSGHSGAGEVTGWIDWAREMFPGGFVDISVQDAAAREISDKDIVVVASPEAELELQARVTDRLKQGVIAVPGYDAAARALFLWQPGADGWFPTGPGNVHVYRKQQQ